MSAGRLLTELAAFRTQLEQVAVWCAGLDDGDGAAPSVLPDWDVRTLVAHLVRVRHGLTEVLATTSTQPPVPLAQYVRVMAAAADEISAGTRALAADRPLAGLVNTLTEPLPDPDGVADRTVLAAPRGPITALDWVRSRVLDLVVHCDDLSRSRPARPAVALHRPALAVAVRTLAELLAAQAPGRSVEVRVPPFVAVQAVPGPRHTRGTPPNVVETDATGWLRLATGRTSFAAAVAAGQVRATGPRSDLTEFLPVVS